MLDEIVHKKDGTILGSQLQLPVAPASERGAVKAWEEPVTLLTYKPSPPDKNPLFLEKRVYQGSSGRVYPLPAIDSIERESRPHTWKAVHLENEFLRLMVLPEIGGRIHVGLDKRNNYDFFYRQNVIKPALVGLAGPWISGGVEFNWPQHHRPATYMPVNVAIERDPDGSVTIWCSDHDPMSRMKGMHGICLRPGKAFLEVRVRLYNRTQDTQTFLWWANAATHVHEKYQSFFPLDVLVAVDHAKRAITEYPHSQGKYYGVDYGQRTLRGVPAEEQPSKFVPDGSYPPDDLGWYSNIPVPTSYMVVGSKGDFFGGYDHKKQAGTVAIANHHIAPGKKQWTWGNHEFGYAWDRNLTDADGPYVELMSGAYTDNQPDFSFLAPGETKTFSQFWYPIGDIGVPDIANVDAAMRVEIFEASIKLHLQVTSPRSMSVVSVYIDEQEVSRWEGDLDAVKPLHVDLPTGSSSGSLSVVLRQGNQTILRYAPHEIVPVEAPAVATEPPLPKDVTSSDELFLNGLHLEQYRHATRSPEDYWLEATRRDEGDSRCNHALGRWHLRRGEFSRAERYLRITIDRLTNRNPNPYDGEPYYNLGITQLYQARHEEAYAAFYKSTWNRAWCGPGYHRLAEIDCVHKNWNSALDHLNRSLRCDADNLNARNLKVLVLRRIGLSKEADSLLEETRQIDPLDIFSHFLATREVPVDGQSRLDLVFDLERGGFLEEALDVLIATISSKSDGTSALLLYAQADILNHLGRQQESGVVLERAASSSRDYLFPNRLEEMILLQRAIAENPEDAVALYALGNFFYDRRRYEEAISVWERVTRLDPTFPTAWRNLGFAYFNALHDTDRALNAFDNARTCAPQDARILYEHDQLLRRTGKSLEARLSDLEKYTELVDKRDDLSVEFATLLNSLGRSDEALRILLSREFQPWEGGEGLVLAQYVRAYTLLAENALHEGNPQYALRLLANASTPQRNLSEAKHLFMNLSMIDYWFGVAFAQSGDRAAADAHWKRAASQKGDFQRMKVQSVSESSYWSAMSLRKLGREQEAQDLFRSILEYGELLEKQEPKIDYFATSLPAMLLFDEDLKERQIITARFLQAQATLGMGGEDQGLKLLEEVMQLDPNHSGAIDLLRSYRGDRCRDQ